MATPQHIQLIQRAAMAVRQSVGQVLVGKEQVVDLLLVALFCEGHVLFEDVPGTGKTTLSKTLAHSLGGSFQRIQCTPDLLPSDMTGITFFNQQKSAFEFRAGPLMANIVLADEINRATPRSQAALLEAMEERQISVERETMPLPRPFLVIATQNPIELEGTFPLPEAQLDRFMMRLRLDYPSLAEERLILQRFRDARPLEAVRPVLSAEQLLEAQAAVRQVIVEPALEQYIVEIVRATRNHSTIELGVSPRGSLALYRAGQAYAAIHGRGYVLPDDIKILSGPILTHRLLASNQARLQGQAMESIIEEIVRSIPVPVES